MNLGKLSRRVSIHRPPNPEIDLDKLGQPLNEWCLVKKVWASIEPLSGRELASAQQMHAEITTKIVIRYREDVDRTMRIVYRGKEFSILYILHKDFAKRELHLMCKENQ